jgi:hypothetical protein
MIRLPKVFMCGLILASLVGCLPSDGSDETAVDPVSADPETQPGTSNSPPTISGSPKLAVTVGESYSFTPTASDPDGDPLTFTIQNKPDWATFSSDSGQLSGTPDAGDAGSYSDISITVSDGSLSDSLEPYSVTVDQISMGSLTLSWTPPTQNNDGSSLNDLAGYRIYYGVSEGSYPNRIEIDNPGISSYVIENLSPDTYYFVSTSVNSGGVESNYSNVASASIN